MKLVQPFIISITILIIGFSCAFAQTGTTTSSSVSATGSVEGQDPRVTTNPAIREKLVGDLSKRYPKIGNSSVKWEKVKGGYYAIYSFENTEYMTRYDKAGNFQKSFTKSVWNESNVPAAIRESYNNSKIKESYVSGYWVALDPDRGYYLELREKSGKTSNVYIDEKGKISRAPFSDSNRGKRNKN